MTDVISNELMNELGALKQRDEWGEREREKQERREEEGAPLHFIAQSLTSCTDR